MPRMAIDCRRASASLAAIQPEWDALARVSAATIFETPSFLVPWWQTFGADLAPHLVELRDGSGDLVGLAPLYLDQQGKLSLIGCGLADYGSFPCQGGREAELLVAVLDDFERSEAREVDLHAVPEHLPLAQLLPPMAQERGLFASVEEETVCPRFELPRSFDEYLAGLSKKDRHELRRKQRRLEAEDDVRWWLVEDMGDLPAALDTFMALHRSSKGRKAIFMDEPMEAFFRAMATSIFERGWLQLSFLAVHGETVACNFGFDFGGAVSLYNSGYNLEFSRLSVGLLMVAYGIRHAIETGRRQYDFLRGNERYKYELGGVDRRVLRLRVARTRESLVSRQSLVFGP